MSDSGSGSLTQRQLRWDYADRTYYNYTGAHLSPILAKLNDQMRSYDMCNNECLLHEIIDTTYNDIVSVLQSASSLFVPLYNKNFHKFWWDEELKLLKEASVESNQVWKAAGKPRHGPIYIKRQSCRMQYRHSLKEKQTLAIVTYTNELHEALLKKDGSAFWKCWRSKFEFASKCREIEGCVDNSVIADKFALHFRNTFSYNNLDRVQALKDEYSKLNENYFGLPSSTTNPFDTKLVSKIIIDLKNGKAADVVGLTSEHLLLSHPVLRVILSKLFNVIFPVSYTHLTLPTKRIV